ncbi:hypothetical protein [Streptomyces sp. NPDC007172]|uniref:hypothetical protein n=1 Tax=Streptomyces sp. NPDC007172 TaxID=3364776 RepID=UPI0036B295C6
MRGEASDDGRVYQARRDQLIEQRDYTLNVFLDRGADAETYRGEADRIVTVLLHAVGSLEERCEALERKAVRARAEGRAEAYGEIQAELQESGLKLRAVQGKLKEAQQDREVAERLLTEARRAADEYRREIEELRRRQEVQEPQREPEPDPEPALDDYDRFIDTADAELAELRASLERLGDEMSLRRDEGADGRVVAGELVGEGAAAPEAAPRTPEQGGRADAGDPFAGEDGCGWKPPPLALDGEPDPWPDTDAPASGGEASGTALSGSGTSGGVLSGSGTSGTALSGGGTSGGVLSGSGTSGTEVSAAGASGTDLSGTGVDAAGLVAAGPEGTEPKRSPAKSDADASLWAIAPAFLLSNAVPLLAGVSIREMYANPHGPAVAWGAVYVVGSLVFGYALGALLKVLVLKAGGCSGDHLLERWATYTLLSPLPLIYGLCLPASLGPWVSAAARAVAHWLGPV